MGGGVCVTEGGGAGASTPNKDLTVFFWCFVVFTHPPPFPPDPRDEPTNKQTNKSRQRLEPRGSAQPPGSRASFLGAGRSEPML